MIIKYTKYETPEISRFLVLPLDANGQFVGTELATVNGVTYVHLPDTEILPEQHAEVTDHQAISLTDQEISDIKANSPHVRFIANKMQEMIREKYSIEDEQYFSRIGVGAALKAYTFQPGEQEALLAYGTFVENVRQWGRDERAKIGL